MTDGIGRIFGGNNYGVGGFVPHKKEEETPKNAEAQVQHNFEETQVDPAKVINFLANNNIFVGQVHKSEKAGLAPEVQDRIAASMENFELIYGVIVEEFGEENAPMVMDLTMDKLMGSVA